MRVRSRTRWWCTEAVSSSDGIGAVSYLEAGVIAAIASHEKIQHLHAHFATENATIARLASRLTGLPFSFTAHAKDIFHENVNRTALVQAIREARFVVTVSDSNRRYLVELAGKDLAHKIIRLYNGIDLERFYPNSATPRETDLIVAVGRLEQKKGFHHLLQACQLLSEWRVAFRCLIVGDGTEHDHLRKEAAARGLGGCVVFAGVQSQEQLIRTLNTATVMVLPSMVTASGDQDALPTVLLEALACGLPVVSTAVGGIPEIIEHGQTGLLVPAENPKLLAKAIAQLLSNPELQSSFARAGRLKAEQQFDIRKNVPLLFDLFLRSSRGEPLFSEPQSQFS